MIPIDADHRGRMFIAAAAELDDRADHQRTPLVDAMRYTTSTNDFRAYAALRDTQRTAPCAEELPATPSLH